MQTALWHIHTHTLVHGHTRYPGSPRDSAMPPDKTYPVKTAALHEFSLQVAPQVSVLHDSIFAEGRLWVLLLHTTTAAILLPAPDHGSPDTSQSQSGGVSPDTSQNKASPVD